MIRDMTRGNVTRHLVSFSVPIILGNLFQLAYNAVDSIVVGRFAGTAALAAHYLTNQTEGLLYLPAYGFSFTATALIGQSLGANRKDLAGKFAFYICAIGINCNFYIVIQALSPRLMFFVLNFTT